MVLTLYKTETRRLLNDENSQFYTDAQLVSYINQGRGQLATQTEILVADGTLSTSAAVAGYGLSALAPPTGLRSAINVRTIRVTNADTSLTVMEARSWPWFRNYYGSGPASIATGKPSVWSQQTQGQLGKIFVAPTPDATYSLDVEASWTPIDLVDDTTVENLPYPFTDAIPYYASYTALIQAQRGQDAQRLWSAFQLYIKSSVLGITPQWNSLNFPTPKALQGSIDTALTMAGGNAKPAQIGEGSLS